MLLPLMASGQVPLDSKNEDFVSNIQEDVICYTDRDLYLSGEEIWFSSIILINQELTDKELSKVLYLELIGPDASVIQRGKYLVENNISSGSILIPSETLSGVYFLRVYTKFQRNRSSQAHTLVPITIVNTGFPLPACEANDSGKFITKPSENITLKTSKPNYSHREKVTLDINWPANFKGVFCVSVIRKGTILNQEMLNQTYNLEKNGDKEWTDSIFYVPDVRGVSLSGSIRDKTTLQPIENIKVYLSVFGENRLLQMANSQKNGSFLFSPELLEKTTNVFLSIDPVKYPNSELLINNDFSSSLADLPATKFSIDTSFKNLLTAMLVCQESKKAFNIQNHMENKKLQPTNIPDHFDINVILEDYIELSSLEEVFFEIVPSVSIKSDGKVKYLAVANYETQIVSRADLILLDNVPVFDVEELLKIPVRSIRTIQVMNRPYYLGDHLLSGIISITTKTGNFGGYKFSPQSIFLEYQNLAVNKTFHSTDYTIDSLFKLPIPDFRTTLFWKPLSKTGLSVHVISFDASDEAGTFEVIIRGITVKGEPIYGTTEFVID